MSSTFSIKIKSNMCRLHFQLRGRNDGARRAAQIAEIVGRWQNSRNTLYEKCYFDKEDY